MQSGRRYTLFATLNWGSRFIVNFLIYDSIIVALYLLLGWEWLNLPWQPISLIGIAVAFYLGFKNNSSYERLWEARKIWGGIVNASRSFTVMARDFVNNDNAEIDQSAEELKAIRKRLVYRHVAWLRALSYELRKPKNWEHKGERDQGFREQMGSKYTEEWFEGIKEYLSTEDFEYVLSKGNRSSHLLSQQSMDMM
jgi:putative membrane protein